MAIASISLAYFDQPLRKRERVGFEDPQPTVAGPTLSAAAPVVKAASNSANDGGGFIGGRRSALVHAMMSALEEMGLTGHTASPVDAGAASAPAAQNPTGASTASTETASAAGSTTSPTSSTTSSSSTPSTTVTETTTAATSPDDLKHALYDFASALAQALRGGSNASQGGAWSGVSWPSDNAHASEGHRSHHHHRGERDGLYGLPAKLDALATRVGANADATTTASSTDDATATSGSSTAAAPSSATTDATTTPSSSTSSASSASNPAPSAAASTQPLVDAFSHVLNALKSLATPASTSGATGASAADATTSAAADPSAQLARFLHLVSQALRPSSSAPSVHLGILIDVTV